MAITKPQPPAANAFTRYLLPFMVFFAIALVSGLFYCSSAQLELERLASRAVDSPHYWRGLFFLF